MDATQLKGPNEKYCMDCGKLILLRAEICPGCGCRQQVYPPVSFYKADPTTGPMILLLGLNLLWNGLGNIAIGDTRGWGYGFLNLVLFALSIFTMGIPCIVWFAYCGWRGYEFLKLGGNSRL
jgi:hypothetical protein